MKRLARKQVAGEKNSSNNSKPSATKLKKRVWDLRPGDHADTDIFYPGEARDVPPGLEYVDPSEYTSW